MSGLCLHKQCDTVCVDIGEIRHTVTMTSITEGPCGKFRFEDVPRLKIGLVHLDRKRPWPVAINPETGREWRVDMKQRMLDILDKSGHSVVRSDMRVTVSDDPSLREAIGEERGIDVMVLSTCHQTFAGLRLVTSWSASSPPSVTADWPLSWPSSGAKVRLEWSNVSLSLSDLGQGSCSGQVPRSRRGR